jgi:mono/diheme cytochrome c family protein
MTMPGEFETDCNARTRMPASSLRALLVIVLASMYGLFCGVLERAQDTYAADSSAAAPNAAAVSWSNLTVTPDAREEAKQIFGMRCSACHGPEGRGDGPAASALGKKPVSFHDRKWQRSVSNQQIAKVIIYGGPSVGLSQEMSANPDLENKPSVVAALIERVRALGK